MPLCDYFIANAAELRSVSENGNASETAVQVDAKGFDVVPIETLARRLGVPGAVDDGQPILHSDDYEWFVQRLTTPMREALAGLATGAAREHAEALAETAEVDWAASDLVNLLTTLSEMARDAAREDRELYMWVST